MKRAVAVVLPTCAVACTALTHAYDWAVGGSGQTSGRLCDFCPGDAGLRHAPCPGTTDPGPDDHTVFFAVQTVDLGSKSTEWAPTNDYYVAGMDLDCSNRLPRGAPVLCQAVPGSHWSQPLPHGIDNAFAQQVLAPLLSLTPPRDIDEAVNHWIADGHGGFVVIIDHWNGQLDDAEVGFRIVQAVGPHGGGKPTFARDERWDVYADGPDPAFPAGDVPSATSTNVVTSTAYVVGGRLVADLRSAGGAQLALGGGGAGALAKLQPFGVQVLGAITAATSASPANIDQLSIAGLLPANERNSQGLAQVAAASVAGASTDAGCSPADYCPMVAAISSGIDLGPDMPSDPTQQGRECENLSFGMQLFATQIAGVGDYVSTGSLQSCPFCCGPSCAGDAGPD